mmetsp:Transcript_115441/g.368398  ORF Transcript_115441/g.368398 Transcript_115441/m.368398 type:complete len:268 (-) Transcript_115441:379-1182(-)
MRVRLPLEARHRHRCLGEAGPAVSCGADVPGHRRRLGPWLPADAVAIRVLPCQAGAVCVHVRRIGRGVPLVLIAIPLWELRAIVESLRLVQVPRLHEVEVLHAAKLRQDPAAGLPAPTFGVVKGCAPAAVHLVHGRSLQEQQQKDVARASIGCKVQRRPSNPNVEAAMRGVDVCAVPEQQLVPHSVVPVSDVMKRKTPVLIVVVGPSSSEEVGPHGVRVARLGSVLQSPSSCVHRRAEERLCKLAQDQWIEEALAAAECGIRGLQLE